MSNRQHTKVVHVLKGESFIGCRESKKTLYLTVGKEVTLTFSNKKKQLGRLITINLSVNKLYELMHNGLVDREGFPEINRVSLLTRSNLKTTAVIDTVKTKENLGENDIFHNGDFLLFVEETQYISRDDLYVLSKKNRQTYEKELKP